MLGRHRPCGLTIRLALCALLAALSGACKATDPRTQVMLVIDAEDEVRARATELHVNFESRSESDLIDGVPYTETFTTVEGVSPYWPYGIAMVPRGNDARRSYRIEATLYEGETVIAELRARSGFVAGRTLELLLLFSADCLDENSLDCSDEQTCYGGECLSAALDAQSLPTLGGEAVPPAADGGIPSSSEVRTGSQMRADGGSGGSGGRSGAGAAAADGGMATDEPPRMSGGNCGDGVWNDEEKCDTAIPQGMPGACRESCPLAEACKPLQLEGTGCQTHCEEYPVQSAIAGDGCCLVGSDSNADPDCDSRCGNGILEAGERCDGDCPTDPAACPRSNDCQMATIEGDAASCSARCAMNEIAACVAGDGCCGTGGCTYATDSDCSPSCGNGIVEDALGELCEPSSVDRGCPASCDDGDPCTEDITTGTAANCNVRCDHTPVTTTMNGDMCCPAGRGNANNDSDCPAACGNGVIERGEFCDGNCPTSAAQCEDFIPCTRNGLAASPCGMRCTFELVLNAANGDMCCPPGANATTDNDCPPACGNLVVERGEMCDGNCPTSCPPDTDNNPCTANVVVNAGCQRTCQSRTLSANTNGPDGCCPTGASPGTDSDCRPTCTGSEVLCGGSCVQLNTNAHCSGCNDACVSPATCMGGSCRSPDPTCQSGESLCGGTVCVPLNTSTNCGGCGISCSGRACINGICACPTGTERCEGPTSECVPTNTNEHCGSCTACPTDQVCTAGRCQLMPCADGFMRCGGPTSDCVSTNTDDHCGSCTPCPSGERCMAGTCALPPCAGGAMRCGTECCGSGEICVAGACQLPPCDDGSTRCGGPTSACTPLDTNANCGSCGNDCRGELTCQGRTCGCANGTMCGTSCCGPGQVCNGGSCENPAPVDAGQGSGASL